MNLPPLTAVVLAVTLAGCLGLALRPPRWLLADRPGRWLGIAMAIVLVGGSLLVTLPFQLGLMGYLLAAALLVVLPGSAAAAAVGRWFRSGLWACAWAVVLSTPLLIATWLAEGLHWDQAGRGAVLDGAGPMGVGVNLGDAVWWNLTHLILWSLPPGRAGRGRRELAGAPAPRPPAGRSRPRTLSAASTLQLVRSRTLIRRAIPICARLPVALSRAALVKRGIDPCAWTRLL